jgi:hypothetical protein
MLIVYTIEQSEQWDAIVRSFKKHDIYWMSGYVKAFRLHGDGEPLLFFYEDSDVRGINVVMKRDIAKDEKFTGKIQEGRFFDFATPYGYGGWIIEGNDTKKLFSEYADWLYKNNIVCEFVRFHPILQNQEMCNDFYSVTQLGEVVHMDLSSPETIWENITSKNRNVIRKAIKNNVKIYNGRFPEIYEAFRIIYNETMDKDNAMEYYYFEKDFYESILNDIPYNAQVFYAKLDDTIIAASIILSCNNKMNYHLSGSLRKYSSLAPTNLLLYQAAMWGHMNGYDTLYLGGVGSVEDSLFKFKRAFYRGELNHFFIGKKVFNQSAYMELISLRDDIENMNYFPQYRA